MTGQQLKWIAAFAMLLDHISVALMNGALNETAALAFPAMAFRIIGRLAFPIFCFLLVEGFYHTKNIKNYMGRMALFSVISEVPFDLAISGSFVNWQSQNVYFTLLIGLLVMYGIQKIDQCYAGLDLGSFLTIAVIAAGCGAAFFLKSDYHMYGILFIVILYSLHEDKTRQTIFGILMAACESTAVFSFIPIWFYNGQAGKTRFRYFFYWFYPAHLLILGLLRVWG